MSRLYTILLLLAALVLWGTGLSRLAPYLESSALLKDALPAFAGLAALAGLVVKGVLTSRMPLEERHPLNSALALTILFSIVVAYADLFFLDGRVFDVLLDVLGLAFYASGESKFDVTIGTAFGILHPVLFTIAAVAALLGFFAKTTSRKR